MTGRAMSGTSRRVYFVSNPNPDNVSGEDTSGDEQESEETPYSRSAYVSPVPRVAARPTNVSNPGESDTDEPPATPNTFYKPTYASPIPPAPTPLKTDLYPQSNPTLSSPSSTSSHAIESTPPPSTPGLSAPPTDFPLDDNSDRTTNNTSHEHPQLSNPRKFIQNFKLPFHRPSNRPQPTPVSRPTHSPTASTPDSYSSSNTIAEKTRIMVTTDAEQFNSIDISDARDAATIRELIFSKVQVHLEEDQLQFSIYLTELGTFAISEALSDSRLYELCRAQGDQQGSLKFLVSHSSAPVHEPPARQALSPNFRTIPPPVLPARVYAPATPSKVHSSHRGSISSNSEHLPLEVAAGYEADVDNPEREHRPVRPLPVQGSDQNQIPVSPLYKSNPNPMNTPASPLRADSPPRDAQHVFRDRHGNLIPHPPPPPPISPHRTPLPLPEEPTAKVHLRAASDAAERSNTANNIANIESPNRQPRSQPRPRPDPPRFAETRRRQNSEHDESIRSEEWVYVNNETNPRSTEKDQPAHPSPSRVRHAPSPARYKASSPYGHAPPIPTMPRNPPPPVPPVSGESRSSQPSRPVGQPVPPNWPVMYAADQKVVPNSASTWNNRLKGAKSISDMRGAAHPPMLQPGGSRSRHLPVTGQSSNNYIPGEISRREVSSSSGLSKSFQSRNVARPPISSSHTTSLDYNGPSQYANRSRDLISPNADPFPRPQSAIGALPSPTQRTQYLDPMRSPPANSPIRQILGVQPLRVNSHRSDRPSTGQSSYNSGTILSSPHSPPINNGSTLANQQPDFDNTLRSEDFPWALDSFMNESSGDGTLIAPTQSQTPDPRRVSSSTVDDNSSRANSAYDSDSDRDDIWNVKPSFRPKSILRPPLKVRTDEASHLAPHDETPKHPTFAQSIPPSRQHRPRRSPSPSSHASFSSAESGGRARPNTFIAEDSWAPRPPPEDVYERLEDFFPEHDLDKPVIEATSGGTSPTAFEHPAVPIPPIPADKSRIRGKKSIRYVAQEHKKRIDRTSRADAASITSVQRKRSTKLWGSKLEEVTTHANAGLPVPLPDSPTGGRATFKWMRGELIGRGTYGRVYLALNATTGEMIAVKQVEMPRTASDKNDSRQITVVQALKLESETLKHLDHPHIVQYLGFEETPITLSIFLEYVPGGSIGSCLLKYGKFDEEVTKSFTEQILSGLEYLHASGILHRDLKADNILVETSGICKISDFGISKRTDDIYGGAHTAMKGTVFWMAPEMINTQKKGYNFKIDIWSVGCVVLEMWAGMRPWQGDEAVAVMFKLYQAKMPPPVPEDVNLSALADDFRLKCFAINPEERPPAAELRKHPYLTLLPGWSFPGFD